jgi:small subunit ribosomal protein S6
MVSYTPTSDEVRLYEVAVLYPYPMNQKEESELLKGIEEIFAEAGGKQLFKDAWGRRGLAYKIGGFSEGNFVIYYYELDPSKLDEIDEALRILKGMLRHMIVKPPKKYQISAYADYEKKWKEQSRLEGERKIQEKEDKKLKQVVDKARRTTTQTRERVKKDDAAKPVTGEALNKQLEKLISDKDLEL